MPRYHTDKINFRKIKVNTWNLEKYSLIFHSSVYYLFAHKQGACLPWPQYNEDNKSSYHVEQVAVLNI